MGSNEGKSCINIHSAIPLRSPSYYGNMKHISLTFNIIIMQEAQKATSPEIKALMTENENLQHRLQVVENILFAGKEVLTLEEAALFLGMTKSAMYKMTHRQVIPFYRPNGKMVYFEKSELLAWLRQNRIASQAEINERANRVIENLSRK